MKQETKQIEVFIAEDGKEFTLKADCEKYEKEYLSVLKSVKYYKSYCRPDLTEGRGYYGNIYIAVLGDCPFHRALQYMFQTYGRTIEYVQGVAAMANWGIPTEIKKSDFDNPTKTKIGDYYNDADRVFISNKIVVGFPQPVWIK